MSAFNILNTLFSVITTHMATLEKDATKPVTIDSCVIIWSRLPPLLKSACEKKKIPNSNDFTEMLQFIAKYFIDDLKTESLDITRFAEWICNKYPDSFVDRVDQRITGDGVKTLQIQIWNEIQLEKSIRHVITVSNHDDDQSCKPGKSLCKNRKRKTYFDEYGCLANQPQLPVHESEEAQNEKKGFLFREASTSISTRNNIAIQECLVVTYPTQRKEISKLSSGCISPFLREWPLLQEEEHFFHHASILLGKDVFSEFRNNLSKYSDPINNLMKQFCIGHKNHAKATELRTSLLACIEAKNIFHNNNLAPILAIFPLLISYFSEKNLLFKIAEEKTTDDYTEKSVGTRNPLLIVKGLSLYDMNATCFVRVGEETCFHSENVLNGILITVLCYIVFEIDYPEESKKTFEFIVKAFLNIKICNTKRVKGEKAPSSRDCTIN